MLLENIKSTFISKLIFSYITKEKYLGLIKYNKELQKRFDITKYDYLKLLIEKKYLNILKEKVLFKFIKKNLIILLINYLMSIQKKNVISNFIKIIKIYYPLKKI